MRYIILAFVLVSLVVVAVKPYAVTTFFFGPSVQAPVYPAN
jgi:hypothetical protein